MPPKRAFYIAQDTPNVSPKLGPTYEPPLSFPLSGRALRSGTIGVGLGVRRRIKRPTKILYLLVIFFLLYWFGIRHGLGLEAQRPLPLGFAPPHGHRQRPRTMSFAGNGLAELIAPRRGAQPEHPFYELMERGEETWRLVRSRQSKTLSAAVKEYRRRYGMEPPAGFARWFAWARQHNVELVDEYDLMMRDILAHHALEPETFIQRSADVHGAKFSYTLNITRDAVTITGDRAKHPRPQKLAAMIDGLRHALPHDFSLVVTGNDHDISSVVLGADQRQRAMELVQKKQHFTAAELKQLENPGRTPVWGWFKACSRDSPANLVSDAEYMTPGPKAFIHDHVATMDFCEFPQLKRLHGAFSVDREDRSPSVLKPWLVHSKLPGDASFLLPPIEGFSNLTTDDIPSLGTWEDKLDPRVHWRGSTTGGFSTQIDWHESHRMRLHFLFNGRKGNDSAWATADQEVMVPDGHGGYERVSRSQLQLSSAYGDVKLAGGAIQCPNQEICTEINDEVEFGPVLLPKNTWMFRYFLDVDGNGWSERFHRLLSSASPVLKMTIFADWNIDRLIPWYHYIPIQPDYSDLYEVLAFFIGPIREDGTVDHAKGHDYLGKKIGEAGQDFSLNHWRWVDMQAYTYRLLLELQRLHQLDRDAASYRPSEA